MTTIYQTAEEAIAHSRSHDEIAYCADSPQNRETLMTECDSSVEANGVSEFWADDPESDDGMLWRVHVEQDSSAA